MYDNRRDARQYLRHSIVTFKGEHVLILDAEEELRDVHLTYVPITDHEKQQSSPIRDNGWDFSPLPLGYGADKRGNVFYAVRQPARRYKQGLSAENTSLRNCKEGYPCHLFERDSLLILDNIIKGVYVPFQEAIANTGVFHRDFAIVSTEYGDTYLHYRNNKAGKIQDGEIRLKKEYEYLDNYLKEVAV